MKLALCLTDDSSTAAHMVTRMVEAQRHAPDSPSQTVPFRRGCLGMQGRPEECTEQWPAWHVADGSVLAFSGMPLESDGAKRQRVGTDGALVRGFLSGAPRAETLARLRALDGAFVAVWWNETDATLTLVTDFLGMQPLYRADVSGMTLFASEVKAFARAGALPVEPEPGAWGATLFFGHQIGARSLLAGATRVAPASIITFGDDGVRMESTWSWPTPQHVADSDALRTEIGEAVRADVAAYGSAYPDAAILLSGGFDSRLIACLCHELGLRPRAVIQSHPDENADADARFAVAFARHIGVPYRRIEARRNFFGSNAYLRFLDCNEVATPSYRLFIPTVAAAIAQERRGVWEGLLLDPALKFDYGRGGFVPYLDGRARQRDAYRAAASLVFSRAWADDLVEAFDATIAAERERFPDDEDGVWRFSVLNRSRFRTGVNPYQVYDAVTPPLTPGMSKRFWNVVAMADPRARSGKHLYRAVFDELAPDGMRVPVASGSALLPGTAGARLYHTQRLRAGAQRFVQRPKVARALRAAGVAKSFTWRESPFLDVALNEASLDDPRLNADWIRARRGGSAPGALDETAREILMYWQAWQHVMRGDLMDAWGSAGREPEASSLVRR